MPEQVHLSSKFPELDSSEPAIGGSRTRWRDTEELIESGASFATPALGCILSSSSTEDADLTAWTQACFPGSIFWTFRDLLAVSDAVPIEFLSMVFVCGDDLPGLYRHFRNLRGIIGDIPKMNVVRQAGPRDIAQALAAGFDDVFDISEMQMPEARARAEAILRRYRLNDGADHAPVTSEAMARGLTRTDLRRRELALLTLLIEQSKKVLSVPDISTALSGDRLGMSPNAVRVLVCHLRKKLVPGVQIKSHSGRGYSISLSSVKKLKP